MYSRKTVGLRVEPQGTPALTGYSYKNVSSKTLKAVYYLEKMKQGQILELEFY